MKLRYLKRAQRQLRETVEWLDAHGALADFAKELQRKTKLLQVTPYLGVPVADARMPGVRVMYLATKHILYYRVNEKADCVEVLRVWHSSRGHRPRL